MRFFLLFLFVTAAVLLAPRIAAAETTRSIELNADVVDYYSNRFILTADGNVRARLSDGTMVTGNTFSMDLKLNRFLIAGNVHVDGAHIHQTGAAFAGYPDLERNYFISEGDTPDRWTYYGLDFTDPHPGRQQPGDAFFFPDLSDSKPYIISNRATIFLQNNVEFPVGARILVLGVYILTPGYVVNYSSNPNFYQNAFAGAEFDVGVPFHGAADAISAGHFRYDQYRGFYTAFDQHFVRGLDYAVFSVDPLTQNQRQYNAIFYKRLSPNVESRLFYQLSSLAQGLNEPSQSSSYVNFATNSRIGRYAVGINADQFNDDLLANAPPPNQFTPWGLRGDGHPFDMELFVQSFEDEWRLFRYIGVPLKFQYRAGYGYNYDSYGLPTIEGVSGITGLYVFGNTPYPVIFNKYVALTAYTNSMKIAKQVTISAKGSLQDTWYSLPHQTNISDFSVTLARTPTSVKQPAYLLTYDVTNIGDDYYAAQRNAYPAFTNTVTTQYGTFSGLSAFDGYGTTRTLSGSIVYTPTPYFALNLTMQHFNTFPPDIPEVSGGPPNQFIADVRVRISRQILVDVSRVYYFNWAGYKWSPQYSVQFSP